MNLDPQLIVFVFALFLALMGVVIYDLYEKVVDCEATIKVLQATTAGILSERFSEPKRNSENALETIVRPRSLWETFTITAPDAEGLSQVLATVKPELFSALPPKQSSAPPKETPVKPNKRRNAKKKNRNQRGRNKR